MKLALGLAIHSVIVGAGARILNLWNKLSRDWGSEGRDWDNIT